VVEDVSVCGELLERERAGMRVQNPLSPTWSDVEARAFGLLGRLAAVDGQGSAGGVDCGADGSVVVQEGP
jgi:hypothetical protein